MWVPGVKLGPLDWQQAPLPAEPSPCAKHPKCRRVFAIWLELKGVPGGWPPGQSLVCQVSN